MSQRRLVYAGYSQDELDTQYDQRSIVPDLTPYVTYWTEATAAARRTLVCRADVAYGSDQAERLDVFAAVTPGSPVLVYFHGGAWHLLSRDQAGFPAPGFVVAGAAFIALDFASAEAVPLAEIVRQVRAAVVWIHDHASEFNADPKKIFLAGHSSGAHLAAMVLADGWRHDAGLPEDVIKGAVIASGAFDLEPVALSARNDYLNLDEAAARRLTANRHVPRNGPAITVAWGEGELDEFRRQGAAFAAAWRHAGNACETLELAGLNHFDVSNAFGDPDSSICRTARVTMGLA